MAEQKQMADRLSSDEEDDQFEDAPEDIPVPTAMDLHQAIEDTTVALNLFLNNKFSEAKSRMEPWSDRSMYHALGYGTILVIQAAMTFEMSDIEAAVAVVKKSIRVCNKFRRRKTMVVGNFIKPIYNDLTENEIHAELCYAECLLERALLTFIQDENLISFVKGSLKVRTCYQSYKECLKVMEKREWRDTDEKIHFESGVNWGVGLFNLMISLLPTKILRLVEFVGFSGNKTKGLSELNHGTELDKSLRAPMCSMSLLGYHSVITYVLGTADGDIDEAERLLEPCLKNYPKGAMFLFFAGRIQEIKGNIEEALVRFEESIDSQEEWRQFHHLCFWELMWCHSFRGDWLLAMKYAERLCKESRWSRATYMYQKASFLLMCDDQTEETQTHVSYLIGEVPRLKQRIAGKSLPIEKFAVKKAKRYLEQGNRLTLPAFELIYVWNGFSIIGKKKKLVEPFLAHVEKTLTQIVSEKDSRMYYYDDYCLALLLKGVCLRYTNQSFQAEQCFNEIAALEKELKQDLYLPPYAMTELGLLHLSKDKLREAKTVLDKAKGNYKGYSLESRLHFRIHSANQRMKDLQAENGATKNGDIANAANGNAAPDSPIAEQNQLDFRL